MPLSPGPWVKPQYLDDDGLPAAAFRLFFYDAGTSTKRDTYQDADQSALNTNPVVLDAAGRANIFLLPTLYKIVYAEPGTDDPPSSPIWTVDDVGAAGGVDTSVDVSIVAGENLAGNDICYLSDGSGALTAGRWYKGDADQVYSSTGASVIGFATAAVAVGETGTVRVVGRFTGLAGLSAGSDYYISATAGGLTATGPTNARLVGRADTTTSLVIAPGDVDATATRGGIVNLGAQTFEGVKTLNDQPLAYIGGATTLPATVGGVYFKDVTARVVPISQTDFVMSDTEIPANMLNADGKAVYVRWGSSTASTGANGAVELDIGGTQTTILASGGGPYTTWAAKAEIIRIDSDSVDVVLSARIEGSAQFQGVLRINGLNFTAAIDLRTLGTTDAGATITQTYFTVEALG